MTSTNGGDVDPWFVIVCKYTYDHTYENEVYSLLNQQIYMCKGIRWKPVAPFTNMV